ncbi:MAG: glycogen/starch/alpha-glucan phosphorylase [Methylococcales bacterium]|nr:glycogen/starch/alpha-glucan phosphorylase [Methylococcales bacterium]
MDQNSVDKRISTNIDAIKRALSHHLIYSVGKDPITATKRDWYLTTAHKVKDHLIHRWMETMRTYYRQDVKRVYYLSMEFLIGRTLGNSLLNLDFEKEIKQALTEMGLTLEQIIELEHDAALGNGGLGRLAACFLDSFATLSLPGYGYGIRYEYGMFAQQIYDGYQVEHPDNWLSNGNPWEFPREEVAYPIKFRGRVVEYTTEEGKACHHWVDAEEVIAMAYDSPIPGYGTDTTNNMRLWSAKATHDFDLQYFNEGNYIQAVADKNGSEVLSKVLYPDDSTLRGKELRFKQQYFFVSASLQDILRRFLKSHQDFNDLPCKVAIQLNDTHPAIAIPELMRVLVDLNHLPWKQAWNITKQVFSYTCHTLLPEALETWPTSLFEKLLPRHLQIIYEINHYFLIEVKHQFPGDQALLKRLSIIQESDDKRIRMAHLAIVGSHKVNGVAALHTELMKTTIFSDFNKLYPEKIINLTNGVTPRRWLNESNPKLAELINHHIDSDWPAQLEKLKQLIPLAKDEDFQTNFAAIKRHNKVQLMKCIEARTGIKLRHDSLFDVQIKRIHMYKRQLLNVLHIITAYNRIRKNPEQDYVPRTILFAGKAAPGYAIAKLTIKLINDIADTINNDTNIRELIKVVFIPNYDVSTAMKIIPAAELSEQISTAGLEASGTGNMKLALNGALTIGTLDGANIEIMEEVGAENIFIFGKTSEEINELAESYSPRSYYDANPELKEAVDMIGNGFFSPTEPTRFQNIVDELLGEDRYRLLADYESYIECQSQVDALYKDRAAWLEKSILNMANMGKFSSDRTIQEYAEKVWDIKPINVSV